MMGWMGRMVACIVACAAPVVMAGSNVEAFERMTSTNCTVGMQFDSPDVEHVVHVAELDGTTSDEANMVAAIDDVVDQFNLVGGIRRKSSVSPRPPTRSSTRPSVTRARPSTSGSSQVCRNPLDEPTMGRSSTPTAATTRAPRTSPTSPSRTCPPRRGTSAHRVAPGRHHPTGTSPVTSTQPVTNTSGSRSSTSCSTPSASITPRTTTRSPTTTRRPGPRPIRQRWSARSPTTPRRSAPCTRRDRCATNSACSTRGSSRGPPSTCRANTKRCAHPAAGTHRHHLR